MCIAEGVGSRLLKTGDNCLKPTAAKFYRSRDSFGGDFEKVLGPAETS
jgi:hypothetical protein